MIIPWTTDSGEILRSDTGEMLEFLVDYNFEFLTTPFIVSEVGILYLYDIEVSDLNGEVISIQGESLPDNLMVLQTSNSTARLYGYFEEVGDYNVIISASDSEYKIFQEFTIVVSKSTTEAVEDVTDLGKKIIIVFEDTDA